MGRSANTKKADCPHCRGGRETFWYMKERYLFDVDHARRLVQDGREVLELEEDDVHHSVDMSRIYPEHLPHVSVEYPGIIAHIWFTQESGERLHGHLLIDGHHRAARCLQLGIPFRVQLLTEEESREILLRSPDLAETELASV